MKRVLILLLALIPVMVLGQSYTIAPPPYLTIQDNNGLIVSGGCIWTYAAGTTTPIATYADTIGTLNSNPIVADSAGRFTAFLVPGTAYKFVYENVPCSAISHGPVLRTADQINGNIASASITGFALLAASNTFTGATQSFPGGSVGAPALAIGTTAGIYSSAASNVDITANSTRVANFNVGFITSAVQPGAYSYASAAQTLTTATFTALTLNTDVYNIGAVHNTGVNATRMTVPAGAGGVYLVIGKVSFAVNATGQRIVDFYKNGGSATPDLRITQPTNSAAAATTLVNTALLTLAAGDYMELMAYQDSGGNLNTSGDVVSQMTLFKIW